MTETCTGTAVACPADGFMPPSTTCRASVGACDVAEACTGAGAACPADGFMPPSTTCRASVGACDVPETCTGASTSCPADAFSPSGAVCRGTTGACDPAETCTGASGVCPSDALASSTTVCRAATGVCDLAERCTGAAATCPGNAFASPGTACDDATVCNGRETCNGSGTCTAGSALSCPAGDACILGGCNATSGCGYTPRAYGTTCDDSNPGTTQDTCAAGVCVGGCAAGTSSLCGTSCANLQTDANNCGACFRVCGAGLSCGAGVCGCPINRVYTLTASTMPPLVNLGSVCPLGDAYGRGPYGFTWNDTLSGSVSAVTVSFTQGLACGGLSARTTTLNDVSSTGFFENANWCSCGPPTQPLTTLSLPVGPYRVGAANTFLITNSTAAEGLQRTAGAFATINVAAIVPAVLATDASNCGACGHACPGGQVCSSGACVTPRTFSQVFVQGQVTDSQCGAWESFRFSLSGTFSQVRLSGTFNDVTCTGPEANVICSALRTGTPTGTVYCGGHAWAVEPNCAARPGYPHFARAGRRHLRHQLHLRLRLRLRLRRSAVHDERRLGWPQRLHLRRPDADDLRHLPVT